MLDKYISTKKALVEALRDIDIKVAALTGAWGTGKTYLWNDAKSEIDADLPVHKKSVYISIFGVKTINELKGRIGQNIYFDVSSKYKNPVRETGKILSNFIEKWTDYSVTDSALNLALPKLLSDRLVVIDDIERKHASLEIDELLGFLDEYSELHNVKFLLILNDDKLLGRSVWSEMHEKVIDIEIKHKPTSEECFEMVFARDNCENLQEVKKSIGVLKINNIRVIGRTLKIVKCVERVVGESNKSNPAWVASTALLTACHYKVLENEPPFEFIKNYNPYAKRLQARDDKTDSKELAWEELLDALGFYHADDFEDVMYDYIDTGHLNESRLIEVFRQYSFTEQAELLRIKLRGFYKNYYWNRNFDNELLLEGVAYFAEIVDQLDPNQVSSLAAIAKEFGNNCLENKLLDAWLNVADNWSEPQRVTQRELNSIAEKIHPRVRDKLQLLLERHQASLILSEAVSRICADDAWGDNELKSLKNSTIEQYFQALNELNGDKLCDFVTPHLKWMRHGVPHRDIECGLKNFIHASRKILEPDYVGRLQFILTRAINEYALMENFESV